MSKGSRYRRVNGEKFRGNYDRIFIKIKWIDVLDETGFKQHGPIKADEVLYCDTGAIYEEENGKVIIDRRKEYYEQKKIKR